MRLLRRTPLLASAIAVSLLAMGSNAQSSKLPNLSTATQATDGTTSNTASPASAPSTASPVSSGQSTDTTPTSGSGTTAAGSSSAPKIVITGSGSTGSAISVPSITGGSAAAGGGALTGLPTLSGAFVIVAPSVPPTANAPYMQTSNLPEGTVFIVVGAILGFMAMSVLLWRGLVAWSLHRSVKRAALHQNITDSKALFRTPGPPPAPFYKYADRESTISLSAIGHKGSKKSARPTTANGAASNLFFSPTAGAGASLTNPGNRGSNYLPAGYYASGVSAPAGGSGHVNVGHGHSISMSNLGPQSAGYTRARSMLGPSPPDSPAFTPERNSRRMASSSTLNLTQGYGGQERAPSAYLEDLFDETGSLPTPGYVGSHSRNNSGSPLRERN